MPSSSRVVSRFLTEGAARHPERTAIVLGEDHISYAELDAASNQVANLLVSRGIVRGDRVALSCPNLPSFTVTYYGILKAGASVVPLNVLLKAREVAYHLADSGAKAYFAFEGGAELPMGQAAYDGFEATKSCTDFFLIEGGVSSGLGDQVERYADAIADQPRTLPPIAVDEDDTAVILYTSGTTGQPKGAELRHRNIYDNTLAGEVLFGNDPKDPDTYLCVLPLFHSFGQTVVQNGAIAFGGTIVMLPRFDAQATLRLMLTHHVTFFAGVPTMYWGLLDALEETVDVATLAANLRVAVSGGSALPGEIHKQFHQRFGVTILEGYGLSETSPVASFARYRQEPRVGSVGVPIPGVQMKLIEDDWTDVKDVPGEIGEIAIKGHNIMKGYYNRPEATADAIKDGWFRSGDLARKDADGYYYIVDRSKDMIIRGGFNVYPRELEEVLLQHPAVSLVAVIGIPHESHGEEIKAVVVKTPGDPTTEHQLVAWGKDQFAAYKSHASCSSSKRCR
jgi:long-chain acyl-CoA synthetase